MIKNILLKIFVALPLLVTAVNAQDGVDAIEKARQAKEAADKAAAEAAAATEAAIEAAAAKAAKAAREEAKKKKEEDEARKLAEAAAAEEAELDAAASAAAEAAKRKMAAELGLEINDPEVEEAVAVNMGTEEATVEDVEAKEANYNIGFSGSAGFVKGSFFDNTPTGGSIVLTTPFGFNLGSLDFVISAIVGAYPASHSSGEEFTTMALGIGGNLTLGKALFVEGHLGQVGDGTGMRGFAGISLERIMKGSGGLPFNVLIGGEGFFSTLMKTGVGGVKEDGTVEESPSYWGGLSVRLDYDL
tara:strand:+ start:722 stop:1627 length:906 start_codon:yes stop_codon:yes gene_type:complete